MLSIYILTPDSDRIFVDTARAPPPLRVCLWLAVPRDGLGTAPLFPVSYPFTCVGVDKKSKKSLRNVYPSLRTTRKPVLPIGTSSFRTGIFKRLLAMALAAVAVAATGTSAGLLFVVHSINVCCLWD